MTPPITTKVKAAIFDEPTLKTLQITVVTFKGEVQLSGFVDSAQSVKKAGEVARGVKGGHCGQKRPHCKVIATA